MSVVRLKLPKQLDPRKFADTLNTFYDDLEDRFTVAGPCGDFIVENTATLKLHLITGIQGTELYDRSYVVPLLRKAEAIHRNTGRWPNLEVEWAEMCPGGLVRLDVTAAVPHQVLQRSASTLPDVLRATCFELARLEKLSGSTFSGAEKNYAHELRGLRSFDDFVRQIQLEFDTDPLAVLNTNTKCRRLRFLAVAAYLGETATDIQRLENHVLMWASEHAEALRIHSDPKGAILKGAGIRSVRPYINLAIELCLLTKVGRGLTVTNDGRALLLATDRLSTFTLSLEERLYFLFDLLVHDRDIIFSLLVCLGGGKRRKRDVRQAFPDVYRRRLVALGRFCSTGACRRKLDAALQRVSKWQQPDVYMEHVVDPRVSWLTDLKLCRLEGDQVYLTRGGERLASLLDDSTESPRVPLTKELLRRCYFKTFARCVFEKPDDVHVEKPTREIFVQSLEAYCSIVQQKTKSLARNRLVASTLFRYAGIKFFVEHRIAVDFRDIAIFLDSEAGRTFPWRLRWQPAQDDGYLTRSSSSTANQHNELRKTERSR